MRKKLICILVSAAELLVIAGLLWMIHASNTARADEIKVHENEINDTISSGTRDLGALLLAYEQQDEDRFSRIYVRIKQKDYLLTAELLDLDASTYMDFSDAIAYVKDSLPFDNPATVYTAFDLQVYNDRYAMLTAATGDTLEETLRQLQFALSENDI